MTHARDVWVPVCVGIGSNQDQPARQVRTAIEALGSWPATRLLAASSLYANPPMGPVEQPDYVNAVALLLTRLTIRETFERLQAQERAQGRRHGDGPRWGPRSIDLDLLVFGAGTCQMPDLVVPHPGISERNFVLFPLLEICPHFSIPGLGSVRRLAATADSSGLEKISAH